MRGLGRRSDQCRKGRREVSACWVTPPVFLSAQSDHAAVHCDMVALDDQRQPGADGPPLLHCAAPDWFWIRRAAEDRGAVATRHLRLEAPARAKARRTGRPGLRPSQAPCLRPRQRYAPKRGHRRHSRRCAPERGLRSWLGGESLRLLRLGTSGRTPQLDALFPPPPPGQAHPAGRPGAQ